MTPGLFQFKLGYSMKKHIGWVKYCTTLTSISKPTDRKIKPWPCSTYFGKDKPTLGFQDSPEQFFWKKLYVKDTK